MSSELFIDTAGILNWCKQNKDFLDDQEVKIPETFIEQGKALIASLHCLQLLKEIHEKLSTQNTNQKTNIDNILKKWDEIGKTFHLTYIQKYLRILRSCVSTLENKNLYLWKKQLLKYLRFYYSFFKVLLNVLRNHLLTEITQFPLMPEKSYTQLLKLSDQYRAQYFRTNTTHSVKQANPNYSSFLKGFAPSKDNPTVENDFSDSQSTFKQDYNNILTTFIKILVHRLNDLDLKFSEPKLSNNRFFTTIHSTDLFKISKDINELITLFDQNRGWEANPLNIDPSKSKKLLKVEPAVVKGFFIEQSKLNETRNINTEPSWPYTSKKDLDAYSVFLEELRTTLSL